MAHRPSQVTRLTIPLTLEQIADSATCEFCTGLAHKTYLRYAQPYLATGRLTLAACDRVPGYRCDTCDFEFD